MNSLVAVLDVLPELATASTSRYRGACPSGWRDGIDAVLSSHNPGRKSHVAGQWTGVRGLMEVVFDGWEWLLVQRLHFSVRVWLGRLLSQCVVGCQRFILRGSGGSGRGWHWDRVTDLSREAPRRQLAHIWLWSAALWRWTITDRVVGCPSQISQDSDGPTLETLAE